MKKLATSLVALGFVLVNIFIIIVVVVAVITPAEAVTPVEGVSFGQSKADTQVGAANNTGSIFDN